MDNVGDTLHSELKKKYIHQWLILMDQYIISSILLNLRRFENILFFFNTYVYAEVAIFSNALI